MQRSILLAAFGAAAALLGGCATTPPAAVPPQRAARAPATHRGGPRRPVQFAPPVRALAQTRIALLLPQTGPLGAAARSVRDGFLSAYYQLPPQQRPQVRIYDTAAGTPIATLIERAAHAGANVIVGPLLRANVAAATAAGEPRPPILALNFLPSGVQAPPQFFQFALSPTAEARLVAQRVLADGHRLGIAIVPDNTWGTRVLAAFSHRFAGGGGQLLATTRIDLAASDYTGPIERVLLIRQSRERLQRLEQLLGVPLAFVPRRRADLQFIFAPAPAATERMLEPQLRFYYANGVPTYSTSDAFAPNPIANQDLDGLRFLDMPWMLGDPLANAVRAVTARAWPAGGPDRGRLFAFGFDAYRLAVALFVHGVPPNELTLNGLTGRLRIDRDGRVHRTLIWARLQGGQIKILPSK
jgi:outer membrane PBP1 activator LpoA protein